MARAAAGRVVAGEEEEDEPARPAVPPAAPSVPAAGLAPVAPLPRSAGVVVVGEADEEPGPGAPLALYAPAAGPASMSSAGAGGQKEAPAPFRFLAEQGADASTDSLSDAQKRLGQHNVALRKELAARLVACHGAAGRELGPTAQSLNATLLILNDVAHNARLAAANVGRAAALLDPATAAQAPNALAALAARGALERRAAV